MIGTCRIRRAASLRRERRPCNLSSMSSIEALTSSRVDVGESPGCTRDERTAGAYLIRQATALSGSYLRGSTTGVVPLGLGGRLSLRWSRTTPRDLCRKLLRRGPSGVSETG